MRLRYPILLMSALGLLALPPQAPAAESVRYRLGVLRRGPTWTPDRNAHTDSIQAGHMANIHRMADAGALVSAGPFEDDGDLRGIFVWRPGTEHIDSLLAGDPAIASERLVCELHDWLAPAGLGDDYRVRAAEIARTGVGQRDSMVTFPFALLRRGPRYDSTPSPSVLKLIARHQRYADRLRASGQLIFAGGIEGTGELRGLLIFKGDRKAIERALRGDPAVRAGRLVPQVLTWWTTYGTLPGH